MPHDKVLPGIVAELMLNVWVEKQVCCLISVPKEQMVCFRGVGFGLGSRTSGQLNG
jgi:hypothetical protein